MIYSRAERSRTKIFASKLPESLTAGADEIVKGHKWIFSLITGWKAARARRATVLTYRLNG
jgi:hypothetical protein